MASVLLVTLGGLLLGVALVAVVYSWTYADEVRAWLIDFGYRVRPYDMIADRRRWFFQRRTACGFSIFRR